jgi:NTE family protein
MKIDGEDYVDGGTVSPLPIRYARALGADVVIAVDVSSPPEAAAEDGKFDVLLKSFDIMGRALRDAEAPAADVVIRPDLRAVASTDFEGKHRAILAGEKAALEAMPAIRAALAARAHAP